MGRVPVPDMSIVGYIKNRIHKKPGFIVYTEPTRVYGRPGGSFKAIGWRVKSSRHDAEDYDFVVLDLELQKW